MERKELDKAREVVKKALSKINFREENERFNVYMAWLNLETTFGSEEDSDKVLKEALKCNDEYKVYEKVGKMYMETEKWAKAEKIYKILARKFNKELLDQVFVWSQVLKQIFVDLGTIFRSCLEPTR